MTPNEIHAASTLLNKIGSLDAMRDAVDGHPDVLRVQVTLANPAGDAWSLDFQQRKSDDVRGNGALPLNQIMSNAVRVAVLDTIAARRAAAVEELSALGVAAPERAP